MTRSAACALAFAIALGPATARADREDDGPVPLRESQEAALVDVLDAGYAGRPDEQPAGSLLGGLIALVPGFLIHGLGHFYTGDDESGLDLLIAEVAGIALVLAGVFVGEGTDNSGPSGGPRRLLTHAGVLLFAGSWAFDTVGTLKGAAEFDPIADKERALSAGLGYRYVGDRLTSLTHRLLGRIRLDTGRFYSALDGEFEVELGTRNIALDTGVRVLQSRNRRNQLSLGLELERISRPADGLGIRGLTGYLGAQWDAGVAVHSLRNLYLLHRVGFGYDEYQFGSETGSNPSLLADSDFADMHLVVESGFALQTGRRTRIHAIYVQDPSREISPASGESGLLETGLVHRYDDTVDIEVTLIGGQGWSLWAVLEYAL